MGHWQLFSIIKTYDIYVILSFGGRIYTSEIYTLEIYTREIYTLEIYTPEIYTLEIYTLDLARFYVTKKLFSHFLSREIWQFHFIVT